MLTGAHGVAPARDFAHGASRGTAGGQTHRPHVAVEGGWLAQLDQHEVVVNVPGVVVWVADDAGGADELLIALSDPDVVLTKTHFNAPVQEKQESAELPKNLVNRENFTTRTTCSSEQQTQPSSH